MHLVLTYPYDTKDDVNEAYANYALYDAFTNKIFDERVGRWMYDVGQRAADPDVQFQTSEKRRNEKNILYYSLCTSSSISHPSNNVCGSTALSCLRWPLCRLLFYSLLKIALGCSTSENAQSIFTYISRISQYQIFFDASLQFLWCLIGRVHFLFEPQKINIIPNKKCFWQVEREGLPDECFMGTLTASSYFFLNIGIILLLLFIELKSE